MSMMQTQSQTQAGLGRSPSLIDMSNNSDVSTPSSSTSSKAPVPRVGGVRCYWALVTPRFPMPGMNGSKLELKFVHPDPVLSVHLARQQMTLVGHDMLEFIHPSERDQARKDLEEAIAIDDLQGSVTRVRFARLSRIREILGGTKDEIEYPTDAKTFVEDDEYLILDLVLGWVADGLLLAFFHAIRDKDPAANNDYAKRHEEWSNYCGTANMAEEQILGLHNDINVHVPVRSTGAPPVRIFQIYTTAEAPTRPDQLLFSWPPPRPPGEYAQGDGRYYADDYTGLMRSVAMDSVRQAMLNTNTKTSCQARYAATHTLNTEGVYRLISSQFIPYGTLIFACYQTVRLVEVQPSRSASMSLDGSPSDSANSQSQPSSVLTGSSGTSPSYGNWNPQSPQRAMGNSNSSSGYTGSQNAFASSSSFPGAMSVGSGSVSNERSEMAGNGNGSTPPSMPYPPQADYPPQLAAPPFSNGYNAQAHGPLSVDDMMDGRGQPHYIDPADSRPPPPQIYSDPDQYYARPPPPEVYDMTPRPPYSEHHFQPPHPPPDLHHYPPHEAHRAPYPPAPEPSMQHHLNHNRYNGYPPPPPPPGHLAYPPSDMTQPGPGQYPPPPTHAQGPSPPRQDRSGYQHTQQRSPDNWTSNQVPEHHTKAPYAGSRPLIPPPAGVRCCIACGIFESPEWRKSTTGVKELCNACGLRHARQVAKREGKKKQPRVAAEPN